jgi:hypothetical protein
VAIHLYASCLTGVLLVDAGANVDIGVADLGFDLIPSEALILRNADHSIGQRLHGFPPSPRQRVARPDGRCSLASQKSTNTRAAVIEPLRYGPITRKRSAVTDQYSFTFRKLIFSAAKKHRRLGEPQTGAPDETVKSVTSECFDLATHPRVSKYRSLGSGDE